MKTIHVGDVIGRRELVTIQSVQVRIPDPGRLTHLQFRRFAGCAGCNLHLRSIARRHDEIVAAGIHEVAVFHSSVTAMLPHQGDLPLAIIADPKKKLYAEFGVGSSLRAILAPRAWIAWARGAFTLSKFPAPPTEGESPLGMPADFLIATDGRVLALKYGVHAYDQWSVDELLHLASLGGTT